MASPSGVYAFVMLKDGVTDSELEVTKALQQLVRTHIGGFAVPEAFLVRVTGNVAVSNRSVTVATVITTLILYTVERRTPLK